MEPRYPDTPIEEVPISGSLITFLYVSKILQRPEMADTGQLSKDSVYVKAYHRHPYSGRNEKQWDDYRKSGKSSRMIHGLECYAYNPDGAKYCFAVLGIYIVKVGLPEENTLLRNPKIDIRFETDRFDGAIITAYTSIRNLPYWRVIPEAIMERLDELSLENFEKNYKGNKK